MRRGTRVGQAYVAITADGSGINEEIVDAVDDAADGAGDAGDRAGKNYAQRFGQGLRSRLGVIQSKAGKALSDRLAASGREAGERAGDEAGDSILDRVVDKVRESGDRISTSLGDRLASRPEGVRRGIERAFDDDFIDRLGDRIGDRLGERIGEAIGDRLEMSFAGLAVDMEDMLDRVVRSQRGAVSGNLGGGGRAPTSGDRISRMLGAGSRSNILNFFGRSIGNIIDLTNALPGVFRKAQSFGASMLSTFSEGYKKAEEGASRLTRVMGGTSALFGRLGTSMKSFGGSLLAAAPALLAVVTALSAFVSVAGGLVGILAAMAGTIGGALVGAVAALGGAFGAAAIAGGLLTAAFMSMTDAQKNALTSAFRPLKAEMVGLGQLMLRDMVPAFQTWSANLQQALRLLGPVASVMGKAFADAGNILTDSLSGPGFVQLSQALAVYLPNIVRNLTSALGNFMNGMSSMFAAILPSVLTFSQYLSDVTARFAAWAASATGQNSIIDFVDRSMASLRSLWNFTREFFGWLSDILFSPAAMETGNTIFDMLARAFEGFRARLTDGSLERWFGASLMFAQALGNLMSGVFALIGSLYNSGVLAGVGALLSYIGEGMKVVAAITAPVLGTIVSVLGTLSGVLGPLTSGLVAAFLAFSTLSVGIKLVSVAMGVLNAVLAINPFVAAAMAILAIGTAFVVAYKNSETFRNGVNSVIEALGRGLGAVLDAIIAGLDWVVSGASRALGALDGLRNFTGSIPFLAPLHDLLNTLDTVISKAREAVDWLNKALGRDSGYSWGVGGDANGELNQLPVGSALNIGSNLDPSTVTSSYPSVASLISSGNRALSQTSSGAGSSAAKPYVNPYKKFAEGLIKEGPSISKQIADAINKVNKEIWKGMREASEAENKKAARATIKGLQKSVRETGKSIVEAARAELNSAASTLAGASSKSAAAAALSEVRRAQADLRKAQKAQERIQKAAQRLAKQNTVRSGRVDRLVNGVRVQNATLAEYAAARNRVAKRLEKANKALADAISMRNEYRTSVADGVREFGSLLTAEAKVIDGVTQALTSMDITENLEQRLARIKQFQENLRLLVAQGLSNAAYKQLVDAGVDTGGAYAQALVDGGYGNIANLNNLVSQIDKTADALGIESSNRLYQAGVDAARGLVAGLESMSDKIDNAAGRLGRRIAKAIQKTLGIKSPSTVMMAMMDDVGDGTVIGLDNQHTKVASAAARMAEQIAVSPEVARYAASQGMSATTDGGAVSGNNSDPRFRDLIIQTPTEDPHAVAMETLNEIVGRLP